jgi:hypothetical protein
LRERKNRTLEQVEQRTQVQEDAPLARKASGEVLDELLLMELEIARRYKAHLAAQARASRPAASPEKNRILRALRRLDD